MKPATQLLIVDDDLEITSLLAAYLVGFGFVVHVAGEAAYIDDLPELAGTLHAALGLSSKAHANIVAIDLAAVRASPGVVAVLTVQDIPGTNDCGPIIHDDPILADDVVQVDVPALTIGGLPIPMRITSAAVQVVLPPVILLGVMSLEPKLFPLASWTPVIGMLMLGNLIGMQFQGSRNWPFGAALSTVLMTVTLVALILVARRVAREEA